MTDKEKRQRELHIALEHMRDAGFNWNQLAADYATQRPNPAKSPSPWNTLTKELLLALGVTKRDLTLLAYWNWYDQQKALQEGWGLFDAAGSADGRHQLQTVEYPQDWPGLKYKKPKFASDSAAAAHVKKRARAGNLTAQRAITFLKQVKSRDVKKFQLE